MKIHRLGVTWAATVGALATFGMMAGFAAPSAAATVSGTVLKDGKPVAGALVTLYADGGNVSETVYSGQDGGYRLATRLNGKLSIRARAPIAADERHDIDVPADDSSLMQSFKLASLKTPQEISDSLTAAAHFTRVKFPAQIDRQQFQTDCMSCHQLGNRMTMRAKPLEEWEDILKRMVTYAGYSTEVKVKSYAAALHAAFDGTPTKAPGGYRPVDRAALSAKVYEWKLPEAQLAHDTEFNPHDGNFYTTDQAIDQFYVTDPRTNKTTTIPVSAGSAPIGGEFAEMNLPVPFNLSVAHGIHSLQMGEDGLFYTTGAIGGSIGVFDPKTGSFKAYTIPGESLYPHTLRIDAKGIVWFSVQVSNKMGRFDPATGKTTLIDLPTDMVRKDERSPTPYGVDINPLDGSIWYTKLWANKVGRIDPVTFELTEFVPPLVGPRRSRFDAKGGLWIPGYGDGKIARLDTKTMTYKVYQLPTLGKGEVEAPYSLAVHPKTQEVWVTPNQSDRLFRLNPKSGKFTAYPLPVRGLYFRDVIFTETGLICGSNNPFPAVEETVEGGMDSLMCLDPEGNKAG